MICIHPAVTNKPAQLMQLELRTGLRAIAGNRYARLATPGTKVKKASAPTHNHTNGFGGDAA